MFEISISLYQSWIQKFPNHVWLRKGQGSVVVSQDGIFLNESGNVGLAKGGSGDVLAGIMGAFIAQTPSMLSQAFCRAIWVHGVSADRILKRVGTIAAVTPSACIQEIPQILKEF